MSISRFTLKEYQTVIEMVRKFNNSDPYSYYPALSEEEAYQRLVSHMNAFFGECEFTDEVKRRWQEYVIAITKDEDKNIVVCFIVRAPNEVC